MSRRVNVSFLIIFFFSLFPLCFLPPWFLRCRVSLVVKKLAGGHRVAPSGPVKPAARLSQHSAAAGALQRANEHERLNLAFSAETNQTKQKLIFPPAGRLSGFPWV